MIPATMGQRTDTFALRCHWRYKQTMYGHTQQMQRAFSRWHLTAGGSAFRTRTSLLQPVFFQGMPAMLKIAECEEERRGAAVIHWWNGEGAVRVLAYADEALLLERIEGKTLRQTMYKGHEPAASRVLDAEASRVLCHVAARLHAHSGPYLPEMMPLPQCFAALAPAAAKQGGILQEAAVLAKALLNTPQDVTALHGDLHHDNILDGGKRGWLAIDPKGLLGERGFDYANLFCNPDYATAMSPGRLERHVDIVCAAAQLEPQRLLAWITAWAGLSAAWHIEDDEAPDTALAVANAAFHALGNGSLYL